MKDRYLFKAKIVNDWEDSGRWIKGFLSAGNEITSFSDGVFEDWHKAEVDPSTICQCTGINDKHGKLIFEGDIVWLDGQKWKIVWNGSGFSIRDDYYTFSFNISDGKKSKIIGNIHDKEA